MLRQPPTTQKQKRVGLWDTCTTQTPFLPILGVHKQTPQPHQQSLHSHNSRHTELSFPGFRRPCAFPGAPLGSTPGPPLPQPLSTSASHTREGSPLTEQTHNPRHRSKVYPQQASRRTPCQPLAHLQPDTTSRPAGHAPSWELPTICSRTRYQLPSVFRT